MSSNSKTAFVLGATGAVGKRLVEDLVESKKFSRVVLLGRRALDNLPSSDILEQRVVDFDNIDKHGEEFKNIDIGFCTLGTTRGKAGAAGFYKVDHDYVVNSAKVAKEQGCKEFILCTARASDENSSLLYYKTKGEAERDVAALGFDKTLIVRPGFLEERNNDFRLIEHIGALLIKPLKLFSNNFAIPCDDVAKAMIVGACDADLKGKVIWNNADLLKKAKEFAV